MEVRKELIGACIYHNIKKEIRVKRKNMQYGMEDERASKVLLDNLGTTMTM